MEDFDSLLQNYGSARSEDYGNTYNISVKKIESSLYKCGACKRVIEPKVSFKHKVNSRGGLGSEPAPSIHCKHCGIRYYPHWVEDFDPKFVLAPIISFLRSEQNIGFYGESIKFGNDVIYYTTGTYAQLEWVSDYSHPIRAHIRRYSSIYLVDRFDQRFKSEIVDELSINTNELRYQVIIPPDRRSIQEQTFRRDTIYDYLSSGFKRTETLSTPNGLVELSVYHLDVWTAENEQYFRQMIELYVSDTRFEEILSIMRNETSPYAYNRQTKLLLKEVVHRHIFADDDRFAPTTAWHEFVEPQNYVATPDVLLVLDRNLTVPKNLPTYIPVITNYLQTGHNRTYRLKKLK